MSVIELDALVVGAGLSGLSMIHRLREANFSAKVVETGSGPGGVWHWSNYPGARVDTNYPAYQLGIPEVYKTFQFSEVFPDQAELKEYFKHVEKTLDLSKDIYYNTTVQSARFDSVSKRWMIRTDKNQEFATRFFLPCLGLAAKRNYPEWPGLNEFQGLSVHSSFWPEKGIDLKGKRVAIVGTGATGVQLAQEASRDASSLIVLIRTPNIALPMKRRSLDPEQVEEDKKQYVPEFMEKTRWENYSGMAFPTPSVKAGDLSQEQRDKVFAKSFDEGGFKPMKTFIDMLTSEEVNRYMYDFWARRTGARINNPAKRSILVPTEPPHYFAGKRLSLEQDYYEQMDKDHVVLVDLKKTSVSRVTADGIETADGAKYPLDVLIIATGFDVLTGPYNAIKIEGLNGCDLEQKWKSKDGVRAHLGVGVHSFPNMFMIYGPLSPTNFANGPTTIEGQCDWVIRILKKLRDEGKVTIHAKQEAEETWANMVTMIEDATLRSKVDSYYNGSNIPGKRRQALLYGMGLPAYHAELQKSLDNYDGFEVA